MRAIKITPKWFRGFEIKVIDIEPTLEVYYREIGCELIEAVYGIPGHVLFVDEEGKLKKVPLPMFRFGNHTIAGIGILIGMNGEGEEIPATIGIDELTQYL